MPLESIVSNSSADGIVLLEDMLRWNPSRRPTAMQSLKYNYFKAIQKSSQNNKTINHSVINSLDNYSSVEVIPNSKSVSYEPNESPNLDNGSIQQLQQQIGSQSSKHSQNSVNKSGVSIKDQYLARSRYIAGHNTKNAAYRSSGSWSYMVTGIIAIAKLHHYAKSLSDH